MCSFHGNAASSLPHLFHMLYANNKRQYFFGNTNNLYGGVVFTSGEEDIAQRDLTRQRDSNRNWDVRAASVEYSKQRISFTSSFQRSISC